MKKIPISYILYHNLVYNPIVEQNTNQIYKEVVMTKKGMDGVKLQVILPKELVADLNIWADKIGMPLGTLLRTILIWAKNSGQFPLAPDIDLNELRGGN